MLRLKGYHTPLVRRRLCSSPFWARRLLDNWCPWRMASAIPDLSCRTASPSIHQIILLVTGAWGCEQLSRYAVAPRSGVESTTFWLQVRLPPLSATTPSTLRLPLLVYVITRSQRHSAKWAAGGTAASRRLMSLTVALLTMPVINRQSPEIRKWELCNILHPR